MHYKHGILTLSLLNTSPFVILLCLHQTILLVKREPRVGKVKWPGLVYDAHLSSLTLSLLDQPKLAPTGVLYVTLSNARQFYSSGESLWVGKLVKQKCMNS